MDTFHTTILNINSLLNNSSNLLKKQLTYQTTSATLLGQLQIAMFQNLNQQSALKSQLAQLLQIQCIYHPGQGIQNFCQDPECLLPMCSICVGIHTLEHQQVNSFPSFASLQQAVIETKHTLTSACHQLQAFSEEYTADYWNKAKMQEQCRKKVQILKNKVLREVQSVFSVIQSRVNSELQKFDDKIYQKYAELEQELQYLYQSLQLQLASLQRPDQVLKQLIKFKAEQRQQQIHGWLSRFEQNIASLQRQGIRTNATANFFEFIDKLPQCIEIEEFQDTENNLLQASSRVLLNSDRNFESS